MAEPAVSGECDGARLAFVQKEHEATLASLHTEVRLLQEKNNDLSFRLLVAHQAVDERECLAARVKELESERSGHVKRIEEMEEMMRLANERIEKLQVANEESAELLHMAQQSAAACTAYDRDIRDRVKVISPGSFPRATCVEGVSVDSDNNQLPSPPNRTSTNVSSRTKHLFRRASLVSTTSRSPGIGQHTTKALSHAGQGSESTATLVAGQLPQYPEPVPPIGLGTGFSGTG